LPIKPIEIETGRHIQQEMRKGKREKMIFEETDTGICGCNSKARPIRKINRYHATPVDSRFPDPEGKEKNRKGNQPRKRKGQ